MFKKSTKNAGDGGPPKKSSSRSALLLLLLLVLLGAGYLHLNGGLEPVLEPLIESVQSLLGNTRTASAPPQAPAPKPAADLLSRPAAGKINGKTFRVTSAEIRDGVLSLKQGDPQDPQRELRVFLFTKKGEVPAGRTFRDNGAGAGLQPHIHMAWKEPGQTEPVRKSWTDNYELQLQFGQVKGFLLPGKIKVQLPDSQKSQVIGTFVASINGFAIINGKPNLQDDSNETLAYVALAHLLKDDPSMPVQDVVYKNVEVRQPHRPGARPTGSLEMIYRVGDGQLVAERFSLTKDKEGWRIAGAR